MSSAGIPAAISRSARSRAMRGISPRPGTVGISTTCSNRSRVFFCHSGDSLVGLLNNSAVPACTGEASKVAARRVAINERMALLSRDRAGGTLSGAVAFGKIVVAPHFLEPADGTVEFEPAIAGRIEPLRLRIRCRQQLDP